MAVAPSPLVDPNTRSGDAGRIASGFKKLTRNGIRSHKPAEVKASCCWQKGQKLGRMEYNSKGDQAASFESSPNGPGPSSVHRNIHNLVPELTKNGT